MLRCDNSPTFSAETLPRPLAMSRTPDAARAAEIPTKRATQQSRLSSHRSLSSPAQISSSSVHRHCQSSNLGPRPESSDLWKYSSIVSSAPSANSSVSHDGKRKIVASIVVDASGSDSDSDQSAVFQLTQLSSTAGNQRSSVARKYDVSFDESSHDTSVSASPAVPLRQTAHTEAHAAASSPSTQADAPKAAQHLSNKTSNSERLSVSFEPLSTSRIQKPAVSPASPAVGAPTGLSPLIAWASSDS
jgi:hypothetical protein